MYLFILLSFFLSFFRSFLFSFILIIIFSFGLITFASSYPYSPIFLPYPHILEIYMHCTAAISTMQVQSLKMKPEMKCVRSKKLYGPLICYLHAALSRVPRALYVVECDLSLCSFFFPSQIKLEDTNSSHVCEISPLVSYAGENLEAYVKV